MSSPKLNNHSGDQVRELSAHEVGLVAGAKVLEIPRADHHPAQFRQRLLGGVERQGLCRRRLSEVTRGGVRKAGDRENDRRRLDHRSDGGQQ